MNAGRGVRLAAMVAAAVMGWSCGSGGGPTQPLAGRGDMWAFGEEDQGPPDTGTQDDQGGMPVCSGKLDPPLGPCDPICKTGCEGDEVCAIGDAQVPRFACRAPGDVAPGRICDRDNPCQEGFSCVTPPGRANKRCLPICRLDGEPGPSCDTGAQCEAFIEGDGRLGVCVEPSCTRFPDDNCPPGQNCYKTQDGLTCLDYDPDATIGDPCSSGNQCNDAQECVASLTEPEQCRSLCDVSAQPSACPDDLLCIQLIQQSVGACMRSAPR